MWRAELHNEILFCLFFFDRVMKYCYASDFTRWLIFVSGNFTLGAAKRNQCPTV